MGEELIAEIVHEKHWNTILKRSWSSFVSALHDGSIRNLRPALIAGLERNFDIDEEALFLDHIETVDPIADFELPILDAIRSSLESTGLEWAAKTLRLLASWVSLGKFECWEGRGLLYVEALLNHELDHVDDLYLPEIWKRLVERSQTLSADACDESVIMSWMKRREALGESLDSSSDPRILPTVQRHSSAARRLHLLLRQSIMEEHSLLIGREHMPASQWMLNYQSLAKVIFPVEGE